jgi:hypothetical protein
VVISYVSAHLLDELSSLKVMIHSEVGSVWKRVFGALLSLFDVARKGKRKPSEIPRLVLRGLGEK